MKEWRYPSDPGEKFLNFVVGLLWLLWQPFRLVFWFVKKATVDILTGAYNIWVKVMAGIVYAAVLAFVINWFGQR